MNWTEPKPPTEGVSHYDHVDCETPLGKFRIDWKGWKDKPDYDVMLESEYVGVGYELDAAKRMAEEYLIEKHRELTAFLGL